MTEFDVVSAVGACQPRESGIVVDRLDFDVRPDDIAGPARADAAGKATTLERVQGLRRPGLAVSVPGRDPVTGAVQLRFSCPERQRTFLVLALPGQPEWTS